MYIELERVEKAKEVIEKIAKGVDPLSGTQIHHDSILNDAKMVRCFYDVSEVLENVIKGNYSRRYKQLDFIITAEQKSRVVFSEGKIGVNEFSRCVNQCLNLNESRRLTGVELNKKLRKLGILAEARSEEGKIRTTTNDTSSQYGFELEKKKYNGEEYDKLVINDEGKKYLLDNLENIMAVDLT